MSPKLVSVLRNARSNASKRYTTQASIQEWISKTTKTEPSIHTDTLDRLRASHLLRTLPTRQHISPSALRDADELGKGHSMIYFQPETMLKDLGKDGSSTEYNAPHPYTRRMWAGGSFAWPRRSEIDRALKIGNQVIEKRIIAKIEYKPKGDMVFIHQQRTIYNEELQDQEDNWGVKEIRTHVFRPPSSSAPITITSTNSHSTSDATAKRQKAAETKYTKPDISFTYTPTSPLLFRYSALTFNAHKIHYDHPHTLSHEQQPTLLVHGPLTATLLIELAVQAGKETGKDLVGFEYRAVGPIFVDQQCELSGWWDEVGGFLELKARQGERLGMRATANFV